MDLKQLSEQLTQASDEAKSARETMQAEIKASGEATAQTKSAMAKNEASYNELKDLFSKVDDKLKAIELKNAQGNIGGAAQRKSIGQHVSTSSEYTGLTVSSKSLDVTFEKKDITGLAASAGALVQADRDPEVYRNPNRPIRIRDLISSIPTDSNAVEYMRQNVFTNNASAQGSVAGIGAGELVAKAKSEITWEFISKTIPTIAHYVAASRQIMTDAPMMQDLIDVDLDYGLQLESDLQLLLGDGTGQNMTGLLVDGGISDVGEIATGTAVDDVPSAMIDHIRSAFTVCQTFEYYNVNGLVLNPNDFEKLETAKANDGHYILVSFAATSSQTSQVWRIPVIITNAMPEGSFLIGDWAMGAKIRDRETVSIRVSESHEDLFVKNGLVVLAEERYVLTIPRPKAFCKGSFAVAVA